MTELIISVLIVGGIAAFLALLLEIAHTYIADYGEVHIVVNKEKDLTVTGGSPLFFSLMEQGIYLPSACGGKGTCSYCKVRVNEGGGPVLPTERPFLSPEEMADNVRLSCQLKLRNDVSIVIPEELFLVKEYRARVAGKEPLTEVIELVTLDIIEPEEGITFKPGQYIQFEAPAYELNKTSDFRAFSIASPATDHHQIKLFITRSPEGMVSIYVHDYMAVGSEVKLRGPFGDFYFRPDSDREILLVATGSGLAPIRSILHEIERTGVTRKTTLFFGARSRADLFYYEEIKGLEQTLPDFTYIPILSGQPDDDPWDGERGFINSLIENYVPQNPDLDVYICGAPIVIQVCEKALGEKGLPKDRIYYDAFA